MTTKTLLRKRLTAPARAIALARIKRLRKAREEHIAQERFHFKQVGLDYADRREYHAEEAIKSMKKASFARKKFKVIGGQIRSTQRQSPEGKSHIIKNARRTNKKRK